MAKNCRLYLENFCCIFPKNGYTLLSVSGRDTSPVAPPRGITSNYGSSSSLASNSSATPKSEFYVPTTQTVLPQQPTHFHSNRHHHNVQHSAKLLPTTTTTTTSVFNNTLIDLQNHNSSINFNDIHEQFRQLVMKDILAYQAQREFKTQPLIQL